MLDPNAIPSATLATAWVTMERDTQRIHAAFRSRMRAAPEVQQCYALAGEWDYLVILAASSVAHYREVAERLFVDEGNVRRYDTRLVFDTVKLGLALPTHIEPFFRGLVSSIDIVYFVIVAVVALAFAAKRLDRLRSEAD